MSDPKYLDNTGLQKLVDKIKESDEQLIQSNPNLMDNPDFRINQRGKTEYSIGYTVDRWFVDKNTGGVVGISTDGGINLAAPSTELKIKQFIECDLTGMKLTLSASIDGEVLTIPGFTASKNMTSWGTQVKKWNSAHTGYILFGINSSDLYYVIICVGSSNLHIDWVKLELGSVATLFISPEPATELVKCQRYYQLIKAPLRGCSLVKNRCYFSFRLPQSMRLTPSVILPEINENTAIVETPYATTITGWSVYEAETAGINDSAGQISLTNSDTSKYATENVYRAHVYPIALSADF